MRIKIKSRSEDFIVREILDIPRHEKEGPYSLYILWKRGWNTADLLERLSREMNIPYGRFSYGGRKDRHASTTQHITILNGPASDLLQKDYSLKFIRTISRPMSPLMIRANHFRITVRGLDAGEAERAAQQAAEAERDGLPNYFDDQRFGSYDREQGFLAEKIIKGEFNGALKAYLTMPHPDDRKTEKERKKSLFLHWADWRSCLDKAVFREEKAAFLYLLKEVRGFLPLLQKIPKEEMSLFFSAYQSFLWNEVLKALLSASRLTLFSHAGLAGDYLFYRNADRETSSYLRRLRIPMPASRMEFPDERVKDIYQKVVDERGIRYSWFNTRQIRQAYFKSTEREALVFPGQFRLKAAMDESAPHKKKAVMEFTLPRGSYGTMLVKRIFSGAAP